MQPYSKIYEVKWADIDPNRHMRHTAYNDYAAQTRVAMFSDYGLSVSKIGQMGFGPILFREETIFLREIDLMETITVTCLLTKMRDDGSRWSFLHEIFKGDTRGIKAAEITVDGAWLDLEKRKLGIPPAELIDLFNRFPERENVKSKT